MAQRVADTLAELRTRAIYSREQDLVFCHPERAGERGTMVERALREGRLLAQT